MRKEQQMDNGRSTNANVIATPKLTTVQPKRKLSDSGESSDS